MKRTPGLYDFAMQRALAEEQLITQSHTQLLSSYQWLCLQSLHGNVASGAYDQCTPRFSGRILHGSNWTRWRLLLHGLATCFHYLRLLCTNFAYLNRATLHKLDLAHSISISASHSSVRYALLAACQMAAVLKRLGAIGIHSHSSPCKIFQT